MKQTEIELLTNLANLDASQMRTLNRYYLHPRDQRCCSKCLVIHTGIEANFHLKKYERGKKVFNVWCKACKSQYNAELTLRYRQVPEQFIRSRFKSYRGRAKAENLLFDLTADHLVEQWERQQGLCFYTAKPIDFRLTTDSRACPHRQTPSLDRLDPEKGYTIGNVVWCAYVINRMKNDLTYQDFLEACSLILNIRSEHDGTHILRGG